MQRWGAALIGLLGLALLGCSDSRRASTIICPWAPGGGTDQVSRAMAEGLQKVCGQPFLVVNKVGGSGGIGHRAGADARPDGLTLTMITFELSTMREMGISQLTYRDYEPLLQVNADAAAIVVKHDAPWKDIHEFLAAIRATPGKIKMSGTATQGAWDLARAGMLHAAGLPVDSVLWIPNKGAAPSIVDLLGGHIESVCCSVPEVTSQLESGEVRVLAVMSEQRLEAFPDIPTLKESGVDWVAVGWRGLALPKGTPPEIVRELAERCRVVAESPEFRERMAKFGFAVQVRVGEEFSRFLSEQEELWKPVIEAAGYRG